MGGIAKSICVLKVVRFLRSSRQAGYHNPWSTEGNSVGKWNCDWASVDCSVDSGRRIRITRRESVGNGDLTGHYNCGSQLERCLKVERQFVVQVVLLTNTNHSTKGVDKPKGKSRWRYLKELWWRHHTELSSILGFKRLESWEVTTTSTKSTRHLNFTFGVKT